MWTCSWILLLVVSLAFLHHVNCNENSPGMATTNISPASELQNKSEPTENIAKLKNTITVSTAPHSSDEQIGQIIEEVLVRLDSAVELLLELESWIQDSIISIANATESTSNSTRSFETAQQMSENAARMFAAAKGDPKDNERGSNAKAADVEAVRRGVEAEATYGKAKEAYSIVHTRHVSLEQLLSKMETASAEVENLISAAQNAFEELGEDGMKRKQQQLDEPKEEFEKSCKKTKIAIEEYHALKRKLDSAKEKNKLANEAFQRANALRLKARDAFYEPLPSTTLATPLPPPDRPPVIPPEITEEPEPATELPNLAVASPKPNVDADEKKEDEGTNLTALYVCLGIGAVLLVLAGVGAAAGFVVRKKLKNKKKKGPAKSNADLEKALVDAEGHGVAGDMGVALVADLPPVPMPVRRPIHAKRPGEKKTTGPVRQMEAGKIVKTGFAFEGPLKFDATGNHGPLVHATEGQQSHSLRDVFFSDQMNRVFDMGSEIEHVVKSEEHVVSKKKKSTADEPKKDSKKDSKKNTTPSAPPAPDPNQPPPPSSAAAIK